MKAGMVYTLVLMAVATLLSSLAQAQPATPATASEAANSVSNAADNIVPRLAMDDVSPPDAVTMLAKQANLAIAIDPVLLKHVAPKVRVSWKNVTARQALEALLDNYGWQMTQIPGNPIFRISAKDASGVVPRGTKVNWLANATAAAGDAVIPEIAINGSRLQDAIGPLADMARLNIILDETALSQIGDSKVTETWKNVTARQALQALLDRHGLEVKKITGNTILRIGKKSP
jgi:hypothetical protein